VFLRCEIFLLPSHWVHVEVARVASFRYSSSFSAYVSLMASSHFRVVALERWEGSSEYAKAPGCL